MAEVKRAGRVGVRREARIGPARPVRLPCTNMLPNGDFRAGAPHGQQMHWAQQSASGYFKDGHCAAGPPWQVWNNAPDTNTTTELLPSELVPGATMIHVTIGPLRGKPARSGNGIGAHWQPNGAGPTGTAGDTRPVVACAWIRVVKGMVCLGVGDGGRTIPGVILRKTGSWEMLQVTSQSWLDEHGQPKALAANEVIIYNATDAPAEFYVQCVQVTWDRGPFNRCPCPPQ